MHDERCTSGSEGGHGKPAAETPYGAHGLPYRSSGSGLNPFGPAGRLWTGHRRAVHAPIHPGRGRGLLRLPVRTSLRVPANGCV
jgi:hypothetical protein